MRPLRTQTYHHSQCLMAKCKTMAMPSIDGAENYYGMQRYNSGLNETLLLQFELHLMGRAEGLYDVLPDHVKHSSDSAMLALRERLHPVRRDALVSAQLMLRRQEPREAVNMYAQAFKQLFEKSYGQHQGMDVASKATLKCDLFL